jgi:hypothetical protein
VRRPPEFEGFISLGFVDIHAFCDTLAGVRPSQLSVRPRYHAYVRGSRWARVNVPRAAVDPSPAAFAEGATTCQLASSS